MIFLADKVCKHFLGLLGELVCPHSIYCFFGLTSHMLLPKSRPQLRHDREVSHHLSRRPREMSTMLPCAVFFLWSSDKSFGTHLAQNLW